MHAFLHHVARFHERCRWSLSAAVPLFGNGKIWLIDKNVRNGVSSLIDLLSCRHPCLCDRPDLPTSFVDGTGQEVTNTVADLFRGNLWTANMSRKRCARAARGRW
jgi:hypothetical protein